MSEKELNITSEAEVSTTELAAILGLTARRVQQLAQDGTLKPVRRGKFALGDSVQRYIVFIDEPLDEEDKKLSKLQRQSEVTTKASKATIAKLEAAELQGKMHRSEDVAAMTEDLIYTMRGMLLALPGRLAVDAAAAQTPSEASELVRKEVYAIMEELSHYKYDALKYEERVRARRSWGTLEGRADDED